MTAELTVHTPRSTVVLTADQRWVVRRSGDEIRIVPDSADDAPAPAEFTYISGWTFVSHIAGVFVLDGRPTSRLTTGLKGDVRLTVEGDGAYGAPDRPSPASDQVASPRTPVTLTKTPSVVTFGRAGGPAAIQLHDLSVEREHAAASRLPDGRWEVRPLNGHLLVDGNRTGFAVLHPGERFVLGTSVLRVPAGEQPLIGEWLPSIQPAVGGRQGGLLQLSNVTVVRGGRGKANVVLHDVSCDISSGRLTAVVGPSGSGKSTLLEAIRGDIALAEGQISVDGFPASDVVTTARPSTVISYVPQDDDVHEQLTVARVMRYAVGLRSAADMQRSEARAVAERLLGNLGLADKASQPSHSLSGGELKRLSVATELSSTPHVLFLDEPGSGLDPARERQLMLDLADLARNGTTVVCVTHSLSALEHCDHVVALRAGGTIAYLGPPAGGPRQLGVDSWTAAFMKLTQPDRPDFRGLQVLRHHQPRAHLRRARPLKTLALLTARQFELLAARGYRAMALLLALPLLAALLSLLVTDAGWRAGPKSAALACLLALMSALIGASLTYADVVTELPLLRRERRGGGSGQQVLASKFIVSAAVGAGLSAVLVLVFAALSPVGGSGSLLHPPPLVGLYLPLLLTCLASGSAGLLVSALSPRLERAVTLMTAIGLLQVAFNGVLLDLNGWARWASTIIPARLGVAAQIAYLGGGPTPMSDPLWRHSTRAWAVNVFGLALLCLGCLVLAGVVLERRLTRPGIQRRGT